MQKQWILMLTAFWAISAFAADIVLIPKGDPDRVISAAPYSDVQASEVALTAAVALDMAERYQQLGVSVAIDHDYLPFGIKGPVESDPTCERLALELHFEPDNMPADKGQGLWIAVAKENQSIALRLLANFANNKNRLYRTFALAEPLPESRDDCPVLYVNLDTGVQRTDKLWFTSRAKTMTYAFQLADASLTATTP